MLNAFNRTTADSNLTLVMNRPPVRYCAVKHIFNLIPSLKEEFPWLIPFVHDGLRLYKQRTHVLDMMNVLPDLIENEIVSATTIRQSIPHTLESYIDVSVEDGGNTLFKAIVKGETHALYRAVLIMSIYYKYNNNEEVGNNLMDLYRVRKNTNVWTLWYNSTEWKKRLHELLIADVGKRIAKNTAYKNDRIKNYFYGVASGLSTIERYLSDNKDTPNNVDPLEWFVKTCSYEELTDALITTASDYVVPDNSKVKSKNSRHHADGFLTVLIPAFKTVFLHEFGCKESIHLLSVQMIISQVPDLRERPIESRMHFFDHEIKLLMNKAEENPKSLALMTILRETGLRIGAVAALKVKNFVTAKGKFLSESSIIDKGNKQRVFIISENLKTVISDLIASFPFDHEYQEAYLFSNRCPTKAPCKKSLWSIFKRIANECNVKGPHVHPHSMRHTLVNNLMACGNKLENVSKFIGHSHMSTTEKYYYTSELRNIIPTMTIPWLTRSKQCAYPEDILEEDESEDQKDIDLDLTTESCVSGETSFSVCKTQLIISLVNKMLKYYTDEQKAEFLNDTPDFQRIMDTICGVDNDNFSVGSSLDFSTF